jgi:hypothetical protein
MICSGESLREIRGITETIVTREDTEMTGTMRVIGTGDMEHRLDALRLQGTGTVVRHR